MAVVRQVVVTRVRCAQAEQFSDAIQVVRSWLPEAEAELKLHSIPDDEDSLVQAIEYHNVRRANVSLLLLIL